MLTQSAYLTALAIYLAAGLLTAMIVALWVRRHFSLLPGLVCGIAAATVLMVPAYPQAGSDTFAPALVVLGFTVLTEGWAQAGHAVRPLLLAVAVALLLSVMTALVVWLANRKKSRPSV